MKNIIKTFLLLIFLINSKMSEICDIILTTYLLNNVNSIIGHNMCSVY